MKSLPENIDYATLAQVTDEKAMRRTASCEKVHFAQNRHRFTKVAFDIFREDATNSLWQLTQDEGGEEWLTRSDMADVSAEQPEESTQAWSAIPHRNGQAVTLAYQKTPVTLFRGQQFGFEPHEARQFCGYIINRLGAQEFQRRLIANLPVARREVLEQQHPELFA